MDTATASRKHTRLFPKLGEIFEADFSRRVHLKCFFDELCIFSVNGNCLGERIIQVSERSKAGIDS